MLRSWPGFLDIAQHSSTLHIIHLIDYVSAVGALHGLEPVLLGALIPVLTICDLGFALTTVRTYVYIMHSAIASANR